MVHLDTIGKKAIFQQVEDYLLQLGRPRPVFEFSEIDIPEPLDALCE